MGAATWNASSATDGSQGNPTTSAEALEGHPRATDDEIILGLASVCAVPRTDVKGLAAPLREHRDRVIEGAGIGGAQFQPTRERLRDPERSPAVNLPPQLLGDLRQNPLVSSWPPH